MFMDHIFTNYHGTLKKNQFSSFIVYSTIFSLTFTLSLLVKYTNINNAFRKSPVKWNAG